MSFLFLVRFDVEQPEIITKIIAIIFSHLFLLEYILESTLLLYNNFMANLHYVK